MVPVSRRGCLSGGCGTWKHPHSVWQAWHLATSTFTLWQAWQFWHWAGSCGALGSRCRRGCLSHLDASTSIQCGRCGTWRHRNSLCVAGVALMALGWLWWRAWAGLVAGDAAALCVAGVALGDILLRFTWQAWHLVTSTFVLRGRRGTYGTAWRAWTAWSPVTPRHFAWQAWHLWPSTFVSRGRRGTW